MTKPMLAYQPEAERYYAEGHWRDGDLWSDFDARARDNADRLALVLDDRRVTYAELRRAAIGVSHNLADGGVEPGDVVILLGRHSIEAAVAMLGCLHRGVVLAPLPPMFNETQLAALLDQTQAKAIVSFGGEKEIAKCREVAGDRVLLLTVPPQDVDAFATQDLPADRSPRHADDLALVLHSSGTTSAPKGIAHSSNTLRYATEGVCRRWGLTGDDIYLTVVEFGFVGGLVFGYLPVLLNGATGVLLSRWKPEDALRLI
jgi:cyclohexanecarboxylate-CoA ligase